MHRCVQDSGKVICSAFFGLPVQVLREAGVGDAGGVVAEHVNGRVDDAGRHHLPTGRQNYIKPAASQHGIQFNSIRFASVRPYE